MSRFTIKQPGVFVENMRIWPQSIEGVSTTTAAFLGETQTGPSAPTLITSWTQYKDVFGVFFGDDKFLPFAVEGFFVNGGHRCYICDVQNGDYAGALAKLEAIDEIALLYSPNAQATAGLSDLLIGHCERLKRFCIIDSQKGQTSSNISKPRQSAYAALYYPWIYVEHAGQKTLVPPGGHIAGIYARVDVEVGVNRAPANQEVKGVVALENAVDNSQLDTLNAGGVNCIRSLEGRGIRVWGARTLSSDPEYKYVNVKRLLIYLEQSIRRGTGWVVFEPNVEATWAKVRLQVENFLYQAWHEGLLMGAKPQEAYIVKCDRTTMTQNDLDNGRLNILVGVAAVKPAEFFIVRVSQTVATKL
jgi:phage tail sheath protein FI